MTTQMNTEMSEALAAIDARIERYEEYYAHARRSVDLVIRSRKPSAIQPAMVRQSEAKKALEEARAIRAAFIAAVTE